MILNDYTWPLPTGLYSVILCHGHFKAGRHFRDQPVNSTSSSAHQRSKAARGGRRGIPPMSLLCLNFTTYFQTPSVALSL